MIPYLKCIRSSQFFFHLYKYRKISVDSIKSLIDLLKKIANQIEQLKNYPIRQSYLEFVNETNTDIEDMLFAMKELILKAGTQITEQSKQLLSK